MSTDMRRPAGKGGSHTNTTITNVENQITTRRVIDEHLEAVLCGLVLIEEGDLSVGLLENIEERLLLARRALWAAA